MDIKPWQSLIGQVLQYQGNSCRVIEILETADNVSLVLQNGNDREIQSNRHGDAHRRVPQIHTLPWRIKGELNPALAALWPVIEA